MFDFIDIFIFNDKSVDDFKIFQLQVGKCFFLYLFDIFRAYYIFIFNLE